MKQSKRSILSEQQPDPKEVQRRNEETLSPVLHLFKTFSRIPESSIRDITEQFSSIEFLKKSCPEGQPLHDYIQYASQFFKFETSSKGQVIFDFGDFGDKFYIILSGEVAVYVPRSPVDIQKDLDAHAAKEADNHHNMRRSTRNRASTQQAYEIQLLNNPKYFQEGIPLFQRVFQFFSGQCFGEVALNSDKPRTASIITISDECHMISMSRADYKNVCEKSIQETNLKIDYFMKLFPGNSKSIITRFIQFLRPINFNPNSILWKEGDEPKFYFLILKGRVELFRYIQEDVLKGKQQQDDEQFQTHHKKKKIILSQLSDNNFVGQEEILDGLTQRQYCCMVSDITTALFMETEVFNNIKKSFPDIIRQLKEKCLIIHNYIEQRQQSIIENLVTYEQHLQHKPQTFSFCERRTVKEIFKEEETRPDINHVRSYKPKNLSQTEITNQNQIINEKKQQLDPSNEFMLMDETQLEKIRERESRRLQPFLWMNSGQRQRSIPMKESKILVSRIQSGLVKSSKRLQRHLTDRSIILTRMNTESFQQTPTTQQLFPNSIGRQRLLLRQKSNKLSVGNKMEVPDIELFTEQKRIHTAGSQIQRSKMQINQKKLDILPDLKLNLYSDDNYLIKKNKIKKKIGEIMMTNYDANRRTKTNPIDLSYISNQSTSNQSSFKSVQNPAPSERRASIKLAFKVFKEMRSDENNRLQIKYQQLNIILKTQAMFEILKKFRQQKLLTYLNILRQPKKGKSPQRQVKFQDHQNIKHITNQLKLLVFKQLHHSLYKISKARTNQNKDKLIESLQKIYLKNARHLFTKLRQQKRYRLGAIFIKSLFEKKVQSIIMNGYFKIIHSYQIHQIEHNFQSQIEIQQCLKNLEPEKQNIPSNYQSNRRGSEQQRSLEYSLKGYDSKSYRNSIQIDNYDPPSVENIEYQQQDLEAQQQQSVDGESLITERITLKEALAIKFASSSILTNLITQKVLKLQFSFMLNLKSIQYQNAVPQQQQPVKKKIQTLEQISQQDLQSLSRISEIEISTKRRHRNRLMSSESDDFESIMEKKQMAINTFVRVLSRKVNQFMQIIVLYGTQKSFTLNFQQLQTESLKNSIVVQPQKKAKSRSNSSKKLQNVVQKIFKEDDKIEESIVPQSMLKSTDVTNAESKPKVPEINMKFVNSETKTRHRPSIQQVSDSGSDRRRLSHHSQQSSMKSSAHGNQGLQTRYFKQSKHVNISQAVKDYCMMQYISISNKKQIKASSIIISQNNSSPKTQITISRVYYWNCSNFIYYIFYYLMSDQSYSEEGGFISWFCAMEDHQFLCEVDDDFIRDNFNLYGLKTKFNFYTEALDLILSSETPDDEDLEDERFLEVYQEATDLYGLIHARFIITAKGLAMMREKYVAGKFGACPRVLCERQNVLPVGMSEELRTSRVKVYCPRCEEVYIPKKKCPDVDGAYFGCSFPSLFLMNLFDNKNFPDIIVHPNNQTYIPRIFGFRIFKKKGSRFQDQQKQSNEITHYSEEQLKKLRGKGEQKRKENIYKQWIIIKFLRKFLSYLLKQDLGDGAKWVDRLKEEYMALIKFIEYNKNEDNDWVKIEATNKEQTKWKGKCWYIHNFVKYDFDLQFEIPATYPLTPIEIELPQLDGMTQKMYRGGKICIDIHFAPLWQKNAPKFGIVHALALALGPWLAAEIPILIEEGKIKKE